MSRNQEIIQAVLGGDRERYSELVELYGEQAYAVAYSRLGDAQAAEDVAQEALIKAFAALRTLSNPDAFGSWLAQITRNLSRTALRRRRIAFERLESHLNRADTNSGTPRQSAEEKETGDLLREALDQLSPRIRETIVLFYFKEQTIPQVAEFLGVSENTIKQRLLRGRTSLREHLEKAVEEGLKEHNLSKNFLPGVLVALPNEPSSVGSLAGVFYKLAALPLLNVFLFPILLVTISTKLFDWLILSDISTSDQEARRSYKKSSTTVFLWMLLLAVSVFFLTELSHKFTILAVVWFLVPVVLALSLGKTITLIFPTWRTRLGLIGMMGAYLCLGLEIIYPYLSSDLLLLGLACMIPMLWGISSVDAIHDVSEKSNDNAIPEINPATMDFLSRNATKFAKILNTPDPLFSKVELEEDYVRFTTSKMLSWLWRSRRNEKAFYSAQLYPDGKVSVQIDHSRQVPPHLGTREEYENRVAEYIRKKWAYYLSGDKGAARSVSMDFFPREIFVRSRGRRVVQYFCNGCLIFLVIGVSHQLYSRSPTLKAHDVQTFIKLSFSNGIKTTFKAFRRKSEA